MSIIVKHVGKSFEKCDPTCSVCDSQGICQKCEVINSYINGVDCLCNSGYYGHPTINREKCQDLYENCINYNTCTKSYDKSRMTNNGNCVCNSGYFLESSKCLECGLGCSECNLTGCLECFDERSSISNHICDCPQGAYFSIKT